MTGKFGKRWYQILIIVAVAFGPLGLVWHTNASRFEQFLYVTSIVPLSLMIRSYGFFSSEVILLREPDSPLRQEELDRERREYRSFLLFWIILAPLSILLLWNLLVASTDQPNDRNNCSLAPVQETMNDCSLINHVRGLTNKLGG